MRYTSENGLNLHKMWGFADCHAVFVKTALNDE